MKALDTLVGLPWRERGRTPDGVDCWGLHRLALAERGVDLPSHDGRYTDVRDREEIAGVIRGEMGPWRQVPAGAERAFDAVLMLVGGLPHHIGTVVRPGLMLHIERAKWSTIEPYTTGRYALAGFFRHIELDGTAP